MIIKNVIWIGTALVLVSACGDDKPSADAKFGEISSSVTHPTGELGSDNTRDVATEFGKIAAANPGGTRPQSTGPTTSIACGQGGTYTISSSGDQSGGRATISYDACCYVADCCFDGSGDWYYSTAGGTAFSYCGSYDLNSTCYGSNVSLSYEGCFGSNGKWVYVVTVASKTFAVSGSYSNKVGELEITAANGSWTCSYTATGGTCTGSSTLTIGG